MSYQQFWRVLYKHDSSDNLNPIFFYLFPVTMDNQSL